MPCLLGTRERGLLRVLMAPPSDVPTRTHAICRLGDGYRFWLLQCEIHTSVERMRSRCCERSRGLPIRRIVFFLFLFFVLPHGVAARPRAGSGLPAMRAADYQGGHEPEDHDEQGEGPRDP